MIMNDNELGALYRATTFRVEGPSGIIDIRVREKHPRIDALLSHHSATEWAYITAWNPRSQIVSPVQNATAQKALIQLLRDRDFRFHEGDGVPDSGDWTPERSVWIAGISRQNAEAIGSQFGQTAVVVGTTGGVAELLFCST